MGVIFFLKLKLGAWVVMVVIGGAVFPLKRQGACGGIFSSVF